MDSLKPFTFFISHRRDDTGPIALLLKSEIEKRLRFVRVFVDVEGIGFGDHFPDRLRTLIESAHATIVLIGKQWLRRHDDSDAAGEPKDWVVHEIEYSRSAPVSDHVGQAQGGKPRDVLPIFVDCERSFSRFEIPESIAYLTELNAERIDYAAWPSAIGPLLQRIASRFKLQQRPDGDKFPDPSPVKARTQPVSHTEFTQILRFDDYAGWYLDNYGQSEVTYLVKTFQFPHFNQAAQFMTMVANHCRVLDHHPEWRNVFDQVTVSLTTWDAMRRVTIYDLNLALFMNMAAKEILRG